VAANVLCTARPRGARGQLMRPHATVTPAGSLTPSSAAPCVAAAPRYPFLLVDRVVELEVEKYAVGYKNVTVNDEFFNVSPLDQRCRRHRMRPAAAAAPGCCQA